MMQPAHVMMFSVSPTVWVIVIILVILLFGAGKLPELARNVGKSAKILKEEINDLQDDPKTGEPKTAPAGNEQAVQNPPQPPAQGNPAQGNPTDGKPQPPAAV